MSAVLAWLQSHPFEVLAVVLYFTVNVAPRPHPEKLNSPKAKMLWKGIDLLCFLTAQRLPGAWKWLFVASPSPPQMPDQS